jgi:hypothetical protein
MNRQWSLRDRGTNAPVTVWDENKYDVDQFIRDRMEGKKFIYDARPKHAYSPAPPKPPMQEKPMECVECNMTGRFYVDDYICCACRDRRDADA